jgi:hypothetical protein
LNFVNECYLNANVSSLKGYSGIRNLYYEIKTLANTLPRALKRITLAFFIH